MFACIYSNDSLGVETAIELIEAGADLEKRLENRYCWGYLGPINSPKLLKYYNDFINKKNYNDECTICTEQTDDKLSKLDCRHEFHQSCLDKLVKKECPVCRLLFEPYYNVVST